MLCVFVFGGGGFEEGVVEFVVVGKDIGVFMV